MNKNEKGYFHKFSRIHGSTRDGNYQKLFNCIAGMKEYDEKIIRDAFKGEKVLRHLKVTRHHLKNLIIRAMVNYYSTSDPEIEGLHSVLEVSILIKKQLYDTAQNQVQALRKQATETENFLQSLYLLQMESLILIRRGLYGKITGSAQVHIEQELECLRLHENLCQYRNLYGQIFSKALIEGQYEKKSLQEIRDFLTHPLLTHGDSALSFKAKLYRFDALGICYRKLNDSVNSLDTSYQMAALFRATPAQIKIQPFNYYMVLNKISAQLNILGRYREALEYADEAEVLANNKQLKLNGDRVFEILTGAYLLRLSIFAKSGDFENGLKADKKLTVVGRHKPLRPDMVVVRNYFNAFCFVGTGQLNKALDNINTLIHGEYDNVRKDLILCAHWMNVIIHFELGNYTLIKRLITVCWNFMVKNKFEVTYWNGFLKQLSGIVKSGTTGNQKTLKTGLQSLLNDIDSYSFIDNNFMRWWVENKLKKLG